MRKPTEIRLHQSGGRWSLNIVRIAFASGQQGLGVMLVCALCAAILGCHDGPLYAMKTVNPFFRSQWANDEQLAPTDYQRRVELQRLVATMPGMTDADQEYWLQHIRAILQNDKSAEMRSLAIRALEGCRGDDVLELCEKYLDDESVKVRLTVCDVLASRDQSESTQLLGKTVGSETNEDIVMAAIVALGKHRSPEAAQMLKTSLKSRNPAVRVATVESLEKCTGKQLGEDPRVWLAYLSGESVIEEEKSLSKQISELF